MLFTTFLFERETKNTHRFAEVVRDGEEAIIGTLYIQKAALEEAEILDEQAIEVAIRAVHSDDDNDKS